MIKRLVDRIEAESKPTVISHESLCIGDWMTYYDYSEDPNFITERLRTSFPDAEIMLFLRAQSSWFASWYRQHVSGGVTLSAEAMLETPVWKNRVRETLEYDRKVKHYQDVFGPDHVRIFYYNDLVADQEAFVDSLFKYFGVNRPPDYPRTPLNVTRSDLLIRAKLLSNRASSFFRRRLLRSPERRDRWHRRHQALWKKYLNRADFVVRHISDKKTISEKLKRQIDDMYAESNARLEAMTGIDLEEKGFVVAREARTAAAPGNDPVSTSARTGAAID